MSYDISFKFIIAQIMHVVIQVNNYLKHYVTITIHNNYS